MKKTLGFILLGFLLSGCYTSSLTYIGTGAGIVQGKSTQSLATQAASYTIKKQTGKGPLEHLLNPEQIKTYETTKQKINPCEQTPKLCSKIKLRVAIVNDIISHKQKVTKKSN